MTGYFVFHQGKNDLEVWNSTPNYPPEVINTALSRAFPFGSAWKEFVQARSVKLTQLYPNLYMLTYTLVLGRQSRYPDGTLHAWGIVDSPKGIYEEIARTGGLPLSVFERLSSSFESDPLFSFMIAGLEPRLPNKSVAKLKLTISSCIQLQLGLKIQIFSKYAGPMRWNAVEHLVYRAFKKTIWKMHLRSFFCRELSIMTFTTLSLSPNEDVKVIGLPE